MSNFVRIGIDVGGTFTHAVALDGQSLAILGKVKVPTTHKAEEGVARGIVESLAKLLKEAGISPGDVKFLAHSTTQATNALLEGDVVPVGIVGMGASPNIFMAKMATRIGNIELAPGKFLKTFHRFIDISKPPADEQIKKTIEALVDAGAKAIAISAAFAPDQPEPELRALAIARQMGLAATCGAQISQLYGLKVRTRTAVINASMLPKMMESANMTEDSVRKAGIESPIMIMRSDGGVMDIDSMRKRPILTMLSGPAAGVAAAMMYLHISDGIFLEVGGTSTDISAIKNGKALVKSAEVGGHKVYLRTLDVRTVGVAGGSMLRLEGPKLVDAGPRSAHIAGLSYVSFAGNIARPKAKKICPLAGDPSDYLAVAEGDEAPNFALTTTCAANLLGLVPKDNCAFGNQELIKKVFAELAAETGRQADALAQEALKLASRKCLPVVDALIKEYKLDRELTVLYGGGGGSAALVPFISREYGFAHVLAENADVISAIGVALALVQETVERQIIQPSADDILRIRQDAFDSVLKMGAEPSTIDVHVEVDTRTNTVRATAFGATALAPPEAEKTVSDPEARLQLAAESMRQDKNQVKLSLETTHFQVYEAQGTHKHLFGLLRTKVNRLRVLDRQGAIRLQIANGLALSAQAARADQAIMQIAEEHAQYGDAGKIIPAMMLLAGSKIVDFSGLADAQQAVALAKIELEHLPADTKVIIIAAF